MIYLKYKNTLLFDIPHDTSELRGVSYSEKWEIQIGSPTTNLWIPTYKNELRNVVII